MIKWLDKLKLGFPKEYMKDWRVDALFALLQRRKLIVKFGSKFNLALDIFLLAIGLATVVLAINEASADVLDSHGFKLLACILRNYLRNCTAFPDLTPLPSSEDFPMN